MTLLDRFIAFRFLGNFLTLFCLIFLFYVSVDVVLQFDQFVEAAQEAVAGERFSSVWGATILAILDFHGPRVFQFFGFMIGLASVAAAGFTLSQMQRSRELVAMLASGIPLHRIALVIFVTAGFLNLLQVLNQEFVIPRLAPVLLREHGQILSTTQTVFSVPLTRDGGDNLFSGRNLDVNQGTINDLLVMVRDEDGTADRRIYAKTASWDDDSDAWLLESGVSTSRSGPEQEVLERRELVESYPTDLSPHALSVRRDRDRAQMLSTLEIRDLRMQSGESSSSLARLMWSRIGSIGVNLLVLLLVLPSFLRRLPAPMLVQSVHCAIIGVPALLISVLIMMLPVPGVSPAVMGILPTALLIPISFWRMATLET
ncbi:MAG: LptF/LptG family permease [Planctomycetota bacterium]|nr:LptF/LptG family permease [Planctomycetota bacterium]